MKQWKMSGFFTSKDNSFEGNFNGIETNDKKKLAMDKDDDNSANYCLNEKHGELPEVPQVMNLYKLQMTDYISQV